MYKAAAYMQSEMIFDMVKWEKFIFIFLPSFSRETDKSVFKWINEKN